MSAKTLKKIVENLLDRFEQMISITLVCQLSTIVIRNSIENIIFEKP